MDLYAIYGLRIIYEFVIIGDSCTKYGPHETATYLCCAEWGLIGHFRDDVPDQSLDGYKTLSLLNQSLWLILINLNISTTNSTKT